MLDDGSSFQTRGAAAAAKARSPIICRIVRGIARAENADKMRKETSVALSSFEAG